MFYPSSVLYRPFTRRRLRWPDRIQRGFTLLELMLVLALMVIVTLVVGTNLRNGFRQQRLRTAADQIRMEWAKGRNEAIQSGRVHVFYHTLQGNHFFVVPQASYDDVPTDLIANGGTTSAGSRSNSNMSNSGSQRATAFGPQAGPIGVGTDLADVVHQRELPQGVIFALADVQIDQRSLIQLSQAADPAQIAQLSARFDESSLTDEQWGTPVYFYPDGTTSTARLILLNDRQQALPIYLRGLTGIVRVGTVRPLDELAQQPTGQQGRMR